MPTLTTPWIGKVPSKLYLQSGQFNSTIKTSLDVDSIKPHGAGIEADSLGNTVWSGESGSPDFAGKLILQSGQFTSTVKTNRDVSSIDKSAKGVSWDGTNTPWCGSEFDKLYLQSGQFNSTVKASLGVATAPGGISFDGCDSPWDSVASGKLFLQSV